MLVDTREQVGVEGKVISGGAVIVSVPLLIKVLKGLILNTNSVEAPTKLLDVCMLTDSN
jgi:hypothetical protein